MTGHIVIAGGSGFIGRGLCQHLRAQGFRCIVLSRRADGTDTLRWDGRSLGDWQHALEGAAALINLAGRSVDCRYNRRNLAEVDRSRIDSTAVLGAAIRRCTRPPRVWIQAATTAIYGDAGDRVCDEHSAIGDGVPVATASKWEASFHAQRAPGTRPVLARIAFVLDRGRGPLERLHWLARHGLGGTVGSGRQWISWIHAHDLQRFVHRALDDESIAGCYCLASDDPRRNADFMAALRAALGRGWQPPAPAPLVRLGCLLLRTEAVLALTGRRVQPRRLLELGFDWRFSRLEAALADLYQRATDAPSLGSEHEEHADHASA